MDVGGYVLWMLEKVALVTAGPATPAGELGSGFANSTFRFQVLDSDKHGAWADELERLLG